MLDEFPSGEAVGESDEKYSIPTRDNIVQGLDWLTSDASKGDCLTMSQKLSLEVVLNNHVLWTLHLLYSSIVRNENWRAVSSLCTQ